MGQDKNSNEPANSLDHVTQDELAKAFTEWDRRFREEPDRFMAEAARLLKQTPETYGEQCAPYLISIIEEQRSQQ